MLRGMKVGKMDSWLYIYIDTSGGLDLTIKVVAMLATLTFG